MRGPLRVLVLVLLAATMTACGGSGKDGSVPKQLRSTLATPFQLTTYDGASYVVGHGIEIKVPPSWVTYGPERPSSLGDTYEWAVGLPADTQPLPAGLQFSAGMAGKGASIKTMPKAAKLTAEVAPGYKFLADGTVEIPGTSHASYLRFQRNLDLGGSTHKVEQVSLFLDMGKGITSTIRFIAAVGDWDTQMKAAYDSVTVAKQAG